MSAPQTHDPLVVNTKDGTCWVRRGVTGEGRGLYAVEGACACPEFLMATLAELAEHGIVGSAFALPMPVGPQQPPFPPAPRDFEEKLRQDVARLQGLLAEAVRDAHRARGERDVIRERVSEPFGCAHCGITQRSHGRQYVGDVGMHAWQRPSDEQVKARMQSRRSVNLASQHERYKAGLRRADEMNNALMAEVQRYAAGSERPVLWSVYNRMHGRYLAEVAEVNRLKSALSAACDEVARLESDLGGASARVAELESERHVTNGALDDAVQALRARETGGAARSADRLTRLLAPSQTLREDPHDGPLTHSYRVGRDLPEPGGV